MRKGRGTMRALLSLCDEELYSHYSKNSEEQASQRVKEAYITFNNAWEDYLAAVAADCFAKGFRYAVGLLESDKITREVE